MAFAADDVAYPSERRRSRTWRSACAGGGIVDAAVVGERQERRADVDQAGGRGDARAGTRVAWQLQKPRDAQRLPVQEHPVFGLAVVAQAFAMIRNDGNDGALEKLARAQAIQKSAGEIVGVRNLAVIWLRHDVRRRR